MSLDPKVFAGLGKAVQKAVYPTEQDKQQWEAENNAYEAAKQQHELNKLYHPIAKQNLEFNMIEMKKLLNEQEEINQNNIGVANDINIVSQSAIDGQPGKSANTVTGLLNNSVMQNVHKLGKVKSTRPFDLKNSHDYNLAYSMFVKKWGEPVKGKTSSKEGGDPEAKKREQALDRWFKGMAGRSWFVKDEFDNEHFINAESISMLFGRSKVLSEDKKQALKNKMNYLQAEAAYAAGKADKPPSPKDYGLVDENETPSKDAEIAAMIREERDKAQEALKSNNPEAYNYHNNRAMVLATGKYPPQEPVKDPLDSSEKRAETVAEWEKELEWFKSIYAELPDEQKAYAKQRMDKLSADIRDFTLGNKDPNPTSSTAEGYNPYKSTNPVNAGLFKQEAMKGVSLPSVVSSDDSEFSKAVDQINQNIINFRAASEAAKDDKFFIQSEAIDQTFGSSGEHAKLFASGISFNGLQQLEASFKKHGIKSRADLREKLKEHTSRFTPNFRSFFFGTDLGRDLIAQINATLAEARANSKSSQTVTSVGEQQLEAMSASLIGLSGANVEQAEQAIVSVVSKLYTIARQLDTVYVVKTQGVEGLKAASRLNAILNSDGQVDAGSAIKSASGLPVKFADPHKGGRTGF